MTDGEVLSTVVEIIDKMMNDLDFNESKSNQVVAEHENMDTTLKVEKELNADTKMDTNEGEIIDKSEKSKADENSPKRVVETNDIFKTRLLQFKGNNRRIVMQSRNGPCPLIAAINALSLQGRITIPSRTIDGKDGLISRAELTDIIGGLILHTPTLSPVQILNYEKKVADVIEILPGLGFGLDVNVRFNDISSFEYTKEIDLFDLLDLRLYHTWKVEGEFVDAVGDMTYSQVSEKATTNNLLMDFLNVTQTQMTYSGLFSLQERMPEQSIAVLFRNNHFHTILRQNGVLYLLATDEGFIGQDAVWEILENIEGDSEWVNTNFESLKTASPAFVSSNASTPSSSHSIASDYQYAKQLQKQENILQRDRQAQRKQESFDKDEKLKKAQKNDSKKDNCTLM